MKYLLKIYNDGYGTKKITGTRTINDGEMFDTSKFILVSKDIYDYVVDAYPLFDLSFPDTISSDLMLDQITSTIIDAIEKHKNDATSIYVMKEIRHSDDINMDFMMMVIKFMLLNNRFLSNGYYFTKENREQLYLQIINENDPQLISMLDDYLLVLDYIFEYESKIDIYLEMKKQVMAATTLDEIKVVYNNVTGRDLFIDLLHA